jgi:hypothetical protein
VVALDQTIATVDVPATGGADRFKDLTFPTIYLNPGELSLLVFADRPDVALNSFTLQRTAHPPTHYSAALALRRGVAEVSGVGEAGHPNGFIRNLGRVGSSVTFGIEGGAGGPTTVRLRYSNNLTKSVALTEALGSAAPSPLPLAPTAGAWVAHDLVLVLQPGANRLIISGQEDGWDSVQLESLDVLR